MNRTQRRQQGLSMLGILIVLIVGGVFFSVGMKLYPAYYDYYTIDSILTSVSQDDQELKKPLTLLRRDLDKKFRINQISMPRDSLVIRQEKGVINFTLDYDVQVPMFYNVDALVKFNKQYEAIKP